MLTNLEKSQIMFILTRKVNCGAKYDRLEQFKRFSNLDKSIKDLSKTGWMIIYKKPKFTGISLNTKYKKEIVEFIEKEMPYLKGMIK